MTKIVPIILGFISFGVIILHVFSIFSSFTLFGLEEEQYKILMADAILALALVITLDSLFQVRQNIFRLKEEQYKALVSDVILLVFGLALAPLFKASQNTRKLRQKICYRCEHEWMSNDIGLGSKVCPKCKSPYWDRPRKRNKLLGGNQIC